MLLEPFSLLSERFMNRSQAAGKMSKSKRKMKKAKGDAAPNGWQCAIKASSNPPSSDVVKSRSSSRMGEHHEEKKQDESFSSKSISVPETEDMSSPKSRKQDIGTNYEDSFIQHVRAEDDNDGWLSSPVPLKAKPYSVRSDLTGSHYFDDLDLLGSPSNSVQENPEPPSQLPVWDKDDIERINNELASDMESDTERDVESVYEHDIESDIESDDEGSDVERNEEGDFESDMESVGSPLSRDFYLAESPYDEEDFDSDCSDSRASSLPPLSLQDIEHDQGNSIVKGRIKNKYQMEDSKSVDSRFAGRSRTNAPAAKYIRRKSSRDSWLSRSTAESSPESESELESTNDVEKGKTDGEDSTRSESYPSPFEIEQATDDEANSDEQYLSDEKKRRFIKILTILVILFLIFDVAMIVALTRRKK